MPPLLSAADSSMPQSRRPPNSQALVSLGALTGGLLSSFCCVLQLALNYTSIGCAGFSALTPYRHVLRAVTGGFLGYLLLTQGLTRRSITTVLLSCMLMASQNILAARNKGYLSLAGLQQLLQDYRVLPGSTAQHQAAQRLVAASKTSLRVQGMRCEACAARLRGNLAALDGVDGCTVQLAAGSVEIWSNSSSPVQPEVLLEAVKATDDSYSAEVMGRECYDSADQQLACPAAAQEEAGAAS